MLTGGYSLHHIDGLLTVTKDSSSLEDKKSAKQKTPNSNGKIETSMIILSQWQMKRTCKRIWCETDRCWLPPPLSRWAEKSLSYLLDANLHLWPVLYSFSTELVEKKTDSHLFDAEHLWLVGLSCLISFCWINPTADLIKENIYQDHNRLILGVWTVIMIAFSTLHSLYDTLSGWVQKSFRRRHQKSDASLDEKNIFFFLPS